MYVSYICGFFDTILTIKLHMMLTIKLDIFWGLRSASWGIKHDISF